MSLSREWVSKFEFVIVSLSCLLKMPFTQKYIWSTYIMFGCVHDSFTLRKVKNVLNLIVCYHLTYAFQSEYTLYSYLNVKKLLARNRVRIQFESRCCLKVVLLPHLNSLSVNPTKMIKHTQKIRRQFADELFQCVWTFCGVDA